MTSKKKIFLAVCISLVFFSGFVFHKPLICLCLKTIVLKRIPFFHNVSISYQSFGSTKQGIYLEGLSLIDDHDKDQSLQVERIEYAWSEGCYKIIRPSISCKTEGFLLCDKGSFYELLSSPWLSKKLTLEQGEIELIGKDQSANVFFTFTPGKEACHLGTIQLGFDQESNAKVCLYKNYKEMFLDVDLDRLPLQQVQKVVSSLDLFMQSWEVEDGFVSGKLQIGVTSENILHSFHSDLSLTQCAVGKVDHTSHFEFKWGNIQSYLPKERQLRLDKFSLTEVMHALVSTVEWSDGFMSKIHPVTEGIWAAVDMEGKLILDAKQTPQLTIHGFFGQDTAFHPFTVQGQGLTMSESTWWMELSVELLIDQALPTHMSIYMAVLESQEMCVKTSIEQMGVAELQMLQNWLQLSFPKVEEIELLEGSISADITLHLFNQGIQSIALDKLKCIGIVAQVKNSPWNFECGFAQGKFKWYFPFGAGSKAPSWELSFKNLKVQKKDDPEIVITNEGYLSSQKWEVSPSWVTASMQGIEAHCQIKGHYSSLEVTTTVVLDENHVFSPFQEKLLQTVGSLERLGKVDVTCKVLQEKGSFNILGAAHLYYPSRSVDTIRFGVETKVEGNFLPSSYEGCKGWFQSDALSENTYLAFLQYYGQKWYALGSMKVTGEWDTRNIRFSIDTHEALFESDDVKIIMPSHGAMYHGDFLLDVAKKSWTMTLPITGAQCIDKKLHLPFEEVSAEVTLQGMQLAAENISATCEGVSFTGRLDLDFRASDFAELKIYPETFYADSEDFTRFLKYLPEFENFESPWGGKVQGLGNNAIFIRYNATESEKQTKIGLKIEEGHYAINSFSTLRDMNFSVAWDSTQGFLEIKELEGNLCLHKDQEERSYHINAQNLVAKNILLGEWDFDVRIEAPTFDILRIVGATKNSTEGLRLYLKEDLTHFFGSKLQVEDFVILPEGSLHALEMKSLQMRSTISARDLLSQVQVCALCGLLDIDSSLIQEVKNLKTEGEVALALFYNKESKQLQLDIESRSLVFNQTPISDISSRLILEKGKIELVYLKASDIDAQGLMVKGETGWEIPFAKIQLEESVLSVQGGRWKERFLEFDRVQMKLFLEEVASYITLDPLWKKIACGHVDLEGAMRLDYAQGWQEISVIAELHLGSSSVGQGKLAISSEAPFKISYHPKNGVCVERLNLELAQEDLREIGTLVELKHLQILPFEKTIRGKGCRVVMPPEMLLYLGKERLIPHLEVQDGHLMMSHQECRWDNEIDTEFDFIYEHQAVQVQGILKDGYYWLGERSFYLQKFHYVLDHDYLSVLFGWDYEDVALDVLAKIHLQEEMEAKIVLKEGHLEEHDERTSVEIACKYDNEDGVTVQSIDGDLYGLEFAFRRNPRTYVPDVMILTGQMKIDTSGLVKSFPKLFYEAMKDLGMGSGYELSGDWVLSKKDLKSSYFKGFLKGRDFEFLGFYFKTLLSEVDIHSNSVVIRDFRLSDVSGVVQIKEVKLQCLDKSWKIQIPEVMVQEFRPSFLKKYDMQTERIKPFVIKDLHFFNIEGTLGSKESFSGKGHLDFINTFKRAYNLLDIPIEIIGRIGFDLGLFVPVIGKLEFDMHEGKIFLKELKHAYSEGKRSKFYLSGYKDSYIGLDGSLFIDIKMKQYVLLKITQPFTLSIRGSLLKPSYSLR